MQMVWMDPAAFHSPRKSERRARRQRGHALREALEAIKSLRFDQFCDAIRSLFGSDVKNTDLKAIYRKISTNPDAKVDWSELFGYFQSSAEESEEIVLGEEVSVFTVSKRRRVGEAAGDKTRRDTVQCIRYVPSLDSYISASQKGAIAMWSSKLRLTSCIDVNEPAWVTGCDYLPGIRRAVTCTERSIVIWDSRSKGKNQQIYSIKPFENSPQCITHVTNTSGAHEDIVLFGDDQGYVNAMRLVAKDLNTKSSKNDKRGNINLPQNYPIDPDKLTYPIAKRKLHHDWVLNVKYFPELRCFASCSPHSRQSFVLEEVERLYDDQEVRGVNIHKGVNCFAYCAKANIIATGGVDKVIRVWHPHIFSRPTGKLMGHLFTIVDICCNERDQHLISLSTARVFRVWDIHTLTCLQVFTDNEERPGEKRIYSMIFDSKHERLITGSSVIDAWPLTRAVQDTMQVPHSHDRPISQIVLNLDLNQVITVCSESVIKVWEIETGKKVYMIADAHGPNIEVTAVCLDKSGYRLATGAFDGSVKVWDFGSGQEIKSRSGRASDEDYSITGMMYTHLTGDRVILAAGWNNKIKLILDTNENYDLPIVREFSDVYYWTQDVKLTPSNSSADPFKPDPLPDIGQPSHTSLGSKRHSTMSDNNAQITNVFKKDYILTSHDVTCVENLLPNTLLTGCSNGNIVLWDIERSMIDKIFEIPAPEGSTPSPSRQKQKQNQEKRVNMLKVLIHKEKKLDPAYLKRVTEENEEKMETGSVMSRKSRMSKKVSRSNSRLSRTSNIHQQGDIKVDEKEQKELMDKLTARIEGTDEETGDTTDAKKEETGEEEKKDPEKVEVEEDHEKDDEKDEDEKDEDEEDEEEEEEEDIESRYITETYDPIIVSVHQDSYIRFWTMAGQLIREVSAITRRQGTPVTAVCHDENCNIIITGDQKGYLTLWDVGKFLKNPTSTDQALLKQVIYWRAHLMKVVSLEYINPYKAIVSGSSDGSVRVWWGSKGRFVGFYSQHRTFIWPVSEEKAGPAVLPYDITEAPMAPVKNKGAKQTVRTVEMYEYPLIFDNNRWEPFRRSAYMRQKESTIPQTKKNNLLEDKKFFTALMKPKGSLDRKLGIRNSNEIEGAYNHHLESFTPGDKNQGAIYRALPVYRIRTPKRMKTPEASYTVPVDNESNFLFGTNKKTQSEQPLPQIRMTTRRESKARRMSSFKVSASTSSTSSRRIDRVPRMTSVYNSLQSNNPLYDVRKSSKKT
ncbi:WD repeat-containing protein 64-like isoform X3 [Mizuhopecten yessoensis]|uniref:WD repeat-containing protein 64-like isoform X3 n=1 Tax=Mizuhopecten yessoensis TaxID=6573 RepID=UPI000B457CD0|nr:WD repeat-containing protein 64-like isoform X3 [Mizuhopecten yessoensis]